MENAIKEQSVKKLKDEDLKQNISIRFQPVERDFNIDGDEKSQGYVEGWASTDNLDLWNSIFHIGAFSDAIKKRGIRGPSGIKFLIGHDWDKPAGKIEKLEYRGDKLWIAAQFGLNISYARDFYEAAKMQEGFNFSIAARMQEYYFDEDDVLHIVKADLYEISAVPFPGNEECVMTSIRSGSNEPPQTMSEFEKTLVSRGLVKSRRDANNIARVAKTCPHLFQTGETVPDDSIKETKPLLAEPEVAELSQKIGVLRAILTSNKEKTT